MPPLRLCRGNASFFAQSVPERLQNEGIVHALDPQKPLFAGLSLPLFLAVDGRNVGLHHVLLPHQICDIGADAEARRVGVRQEDQAVFVGQLFEELLTLLILIDAEAVRQQDHGVGQVGETGRIVFALHDEHTVGVQQFQFLAHLLPPAIARRQSAVSSRVCALTGWLFRLLSSSSKICIQASSWGSV